MRVAHEIVVDHKAHEIRIDGLTFPYYVEEGPEVDTIEGMIGVLRVGIYADNLSVITSDGTERHLTTPMKQVELAWAAQRGREIVREGLADVIAWIGEGR